MKNIITGIFLFLSASFMQAQTPNNYRNPDKIYLDSKDGHNGNFTWQMYKAGDAKDPAEKISQPGYQTGQWMPAIVPGTVLNSLVHNEVYPEPYYGMNNKLDKNIIPDLAKVGRDFYTYWFRTEFDVPENYKDNRLAPGRRYQLPCRDMGERLSAWQYVRHVQTGVYQYHGFRPYRPEKCPGDQSISC